MGTMNPFPRSVSVLLHREIPKGAIFLRMVMSTYDFVENTQKGVPDTLEFISDEV